MSLMSSLFAGQSGLAANRKLSEVTARNIANANTEGYTRKEVVFESQNVDGAGNGVNVSDIKREVDSSIDRMYREQMSVLNKNQTIFEGIENYTAFLGQPNDEQSPASRLSAFEESLITLSNNPGSSGIQQTVLDSANDLASSISATASNLTDIKSTVEQEIKYEVADMNEMLVRMADLNQQVIHYSNVSIENAEIRDEMDRTLDKMSEIMDIKILVNAEGQVNVYTSGGTPMLQGKKVASITYNQGTGAIFAGTNEITPGNPSVRSFENGRLGGLFHLKEDTIPTFQLQLDEMARALVQNFETSDASRAAGVGGLFVDSATGVEFNPADIDGLANRIAVNDAFDPQQGGVLSRLRDGVGAVTPGANGDSTQINAFIASFDSAGSYAAATGMTATLNIRDYSAELVASQQTERTSAEGTYTISQNTAQTILTSRESLRGVNVDDELQRLVEIEHAYAANGQVMKTVSTLLDTIISII